MNGKWLWLVYTILLDLFSVDICCADTGLYAAFVGGVLRAFDGINLYIASRSFVYLIFLVVWKELFCTSAVL